MVSIRFASTPRLVIAGLCFSVGSERWHCPWNGSTVALFVDLLANFNERKGASKVSRCSMCKVVSYRRQGTPFHLRLVKTWKPPAFEKMIIVA
jgi:uracil-DNA glycosylase